MKKETIRTQEKSSVEFTPIILLCYFKDNQGLLMKTLKKLLTIFVLSTIFFSCTKDDLDSRQFSIFKVLEGDTIIEMNGTIGKTSLSDFNKLNNAFANVNTIYIRNCDGSSDDDVNLELSEKVHKKRINIHLMDNAEIASGGVDFFIAGTQRTRGLNTYIGVHSWSRLFKTATDFPRGHKYHLPYIDYYVMVGFSQEQAEDFYYFTIYAADANSIHWMTEDEISKHNLITH